jgi:hypothetical protein
MTDEDPQRAVDIAVAIVDNHLKAGSLGVLNLILGSIDPELLPIGVTLAFLTTSAIAASKLPARAGLVRRFEQSIAWAPSAPSAKPILNTQNQDQTSCAGDAGTCHERLQCGEG